MHHQATRPLIPHPLSQSPTLPPSRHSQQNHAVNKPRSAYRAALENLQRTSGQKSPFVVHVNERSIYNKDLTDYKGLNRPLRRNGRDNDELEIGATDRSRKRSGDEEEAYRNTYTRLGPLRSKISTKGRGRNTGGIMKPGGWKGVHTGREPSTSRFQQKLSEIKSYIQNLKSDSSSTDLSSDSFVKSSSHASSLSLSTLFAPPPPPPQPNVPLPFIAHTNPIPLRQQPFIISIGDVMDASERRKRFYGALGQVYTSMLEELEDT